MLKLLRKGPVCSRPLGDGTVCEARVEHLGGWCRSCLEVRATSPDVEARLEAAAQAELPVELFDRLGADPDERVRLRIARHAGCPLIVLQRLEGDVDAAVRLAAGATLSTSLSPRLLRQPEQDEALFTRTEVEALGRTSPDAPSAGRIRRVAPLPATSTGAAPAGAYETVLARLDELGDRLSALATALSTTGERLDAIAAHLDQLADPEPPSRGDGRRPVVAGHRPVGSGWRGPEPPANGAGSGLLPMPRPAALGTGPLVRADVVVAAWLAVIPLLARRRGGIRVLPPSAPAEPVAGPLLPPHPPIAGELTPVTSVSAV